MDFFEHEDEKSRARVQKKLTALGARLAAGLDLPGDEAIAKSAAEFTKETARRAILADYAHAGEQPISTAGLLLSRGLLAYGKRVAYEMRKHAREADERERINAGSKDKQPAGQPDASAAKDVHRRGKTKGGKARA